MIKFSVNDTSPIEFDAGDGVKLYFNKVNKTKKIQFLLEKNLISDSDTKRKISDFSNEEFSKFIEAEVEFLEKNLVDVKGLEDSETGKKITWAVFEKTKGLKRQFLEAVQDQNTEFQTFAHKYIGGAEKKSE